MNRGQITTLSTVIVAVITVAGSMFSATKAADSKSTEKIADVRVELASVREKGENTDRRMDRLESKIDWLIQRQGGNPNTITTITNEKR